MKFRYFNLAKIRESYVEQIHQFALEYLFLLPLSQRNSNMEDLTLKGKPIIMVDMDKIYTRHEEYFWEDLQLEELDMIIESLLEPALLRYLTHEKGTLN